MRIRLIEKTVAFWETWQAITTTQNHYPTMFQKFVEYIFCSTSLSGCLPTSVASLDTYMYVFSCGLRTGSPTERFAPLEVLFKNLNTIQCNPLDLFFTE